MSVGCITMTKFDGRRLSHEELERIRIAAVGRVLHGESPELVVKSIGFHRSCIYDWLSQYKKYGEDGLRAKPITGRPSKLTDGQLVKILRCLHCSPCRFGIDRALWDRDSFRLLLEGEFQIKVSKTGLSRLLDRLGVYDPGRRKLINKSCSIAKLKLEAKASQESLFFFFSEPNFVCGDFGYFGVRCLCAVSLKGDIRFLLRGSGCIESAIDEFVHNVKSLEEKPIKLISLDYYPLPVA